MSRATFRTLSILTLCSVLSACISHEPRQLVPSISLSSETVSLSGAQAIGAGLNLGMETALNESDSLSNITVLPGVRVRNVTPNGAADLAELRAGDVILEIDGQPVNHPDAIEALAQQLGSASSFVLHVRRNTTVFETTLNARMISDERATPVELYRADPIATRAGYTTEVFETPQGARLSGARIVSFSAQSPLPLADLTIGDTVIALDGRAVESAQGFITALNTQYQLGDTVRLSIARDTVSALETFDVELSLWDPGRRISRVALGPLLQYESSLSPDQTRFSILDLWLFSVFSYQQVEGEKEYSLLSLFRFATGYGELVEE